MHTIYPAPLSTAKSKFLVSGAADNTMKLWEVATGRCLYTWEFPTAVKRVAFSEDDLQVVCITEQRMGFQSAIRIFDINREGDGKQRMWRFPSFFYFPPSSSSSFELSALLE